MHPDFSPKPLLLVLLCLIAASACKKGSSPAGDSGSSTPAITAIGTPVGNPVNKDIDATGGSLTSPDGKLDVTIPAGALSANTTISIQPVTNTAPGGIGSAYQLLPEGTKFSKPVTITFHYSDDDISGSLPYFVYIAFQDSALSWEADLKQRNLDTVAKTVSITSSHFSIWSAFENIKLISGQDVYHAGETNYLEVIEVLQPSKLTPGEDPNDPLSYSLPITSTLPDDVVSNWSLNGEGQSTLTHGFILGSGGHTMYEAPASIDEETTVQVSVVVKFKDIITSYSSGKVIATFNKLTLFHPIELLPNNLSFTLTVKRVDNLSQPTPFAYGYTYSQQSTMDIDIMSSVVTVNNIHNNPPDTSTIAGISCAIVMGYADDMGEMFITSGSGTADPNTGEFEVKLKGADGHSFEYDTKCCATCTIEHVPARDLGPFEAHPTFKLLNTQQQPSDSNDVDHYTRYTIVPKQ